MLKRRGIWLIVLVIVLAAGLFMVKKKTTETPAAASITANAAPQALEFLAGDLHTVETGELQKVLTLSGAMRAYSQAVVKAKLGGEVREVLVREGEAVQAGQVVVRMDSADYESRLAQAQGALTAAQGQLDIARQARDNNKSLLDKNFISKSAYDNTQNQYAIAAANVDSARAALAVAQKALLDTVLRAPINGLISSRTVQPGEKVSPDNRLLDVVDLHILEMEAPVPTQDIAGIKIGQSVSVQVDGVAAGVIGKVSRINPATIAGSRSIMVYIQIANPDNLLRAGMFGQAQLVLEKKTGVLTIPKTAVQSEAGQTFVYLIQDQILQQKPVTLGIEGESNGGAAVELRSGLVRGEVVIKTNLGSLRTGMPVKLIPSKQSAG